MDTIPWWESCTAAQSKLLHARKQAKARTHACKIAAISHVYMTSCAKTDIYTTTMPLKYSQHKIQHLQRARTDCLRVTSRSDDLVETERSSLFQLTTAPKRRTRRIITTTKTEREMPITAPRDITAHCMTHRQHTCQRR